jgi:hypothetical protein
MKPDVNSVEVHPPDVNSVEVHNRHPVEWCATGSFQAFFHLGTQVDTHLHD